MTKTCCPKCKSSDELSLELKQSYELDWSECQGEYIVGSLINRYGSPSYDDDSEVTCSCGWSGRFDQLKPATEKFRVVLILDVEPEERGEIKAWDWKDLLDLSAHENVTVDGVNKL